MVNGKPKNATMSDVARLAGVSMKTVSRVFNNEKYVSEDKKKKILEVAAELNFRPSLQARGLAGSKSYIVGLFVDDPSGDYICKVLRSILNRCEAIGCHLVVEVFREQGNEAKLRQVLNSIKFDAVILSAPICDDMVVLNALRASGVPTARIAAGVTADDMVKVAIDEFQAAFEMTEYLISMGHEKIAFVKGDPNHACSVDRERGYIRAMQTHGLRVKHEMVVAGMFSYDSGRAAAEALLALDDKPTAVFASNDEMASGILAVARERGVKVPEELSIAGFDDDAIASIVSPALTTVKQPVEEMARAAFDLVMKTDDEAEDAALTPSIHGFSLVKRDSVAKLA